jgi:hypothetical protein
MLNGKIESERSETDLRSVVDDPEFPVRTISIFSRLQQLQKQGTLTNKPIFREGMGWGQQYLHEGTPIELKIGFVGKIKNKDGEILNFNDPHDLAINPATKEILASAHTL